MKRRDHPPDNAGIHPSGIAVRRGQTVLLVSTGSIHPPENRMKHLIALLAGCALSSAALAQAPSAAPSPSDKSASSCEAKAVGKNGKPLAGAAKASFMKKCEKEQGS